MIHTARQLVEEAVEGLGVLQVDLINAFNLVDRELHLRRCKSNSQVACSGS